MDIEQWLADLALTRYSAAFSREEVTLDDLALLTEDDLEAIGLPLGPRRRIMEALGSGPEPEPAIGGAERRSMTVLFCDLVGSTALSARFDPEDLHAVMTAYQDTVTEVFSSLGGHVAKYLGDGTLVYFGWPRAHEDQAVRAVRAALAAVEAVAGLEVDLLGGERLASRVGIATGPLVIGDIAGEADAIVGETANLASRLEGLAGTGGVVVDDTTASLVRHAILLGPRAEREAKGFEVPIAVFEVLGKRDAPSRYEATAAARPSGAFVGRDAEFALLVQAWERAATGESTVVLVGGDAGIGKSRLVHEFIGSAAAPPEHVLVLQCAEDRRTTAFHPFLDDIRRRAGTRDADAAILAEAASDASGDLTPEQRNAGLRELLARNVKRSVSSGPTILVVEDLHWADGSSIGLLRDVIRGSKAAPLLVLGTHRPGWDPDPLRAPNSTAISLGGLDRRSLEALARSVAPNLDEATIGRLLATTEGNPLYIEELARNADEGGGLVPISLEASLLARIDRLAESKDLIRVVAVTARTSPAMAAHMLHLDPDDTANRLGALVGEQLLAVDPLETDLYEFRHALFREIAYQNLTRQDRRELHRRAAEHLLGVGSTAHDAIAGHLVEAGLIDQAIDQWRRAGATASRIGSSEEAVAAYRQALAAIGHLPDGDDSLRRELEVLLDLAPAEMTFRGYASGEAYALYERASELADALGDTDAAFMAAWGAYYGTEIRADWTRSGDNVRRLLDIDRSSLRPDLPIEIDHAAMTYYSATGWPTKSLIHADRIIAEYDSDLHSDHKDRFVHDALVCAYNQQALQLFQVGDIAGGWVARDRSRSTATRLEHAPTLGQSLWFDAWWFETVGLADENRRAIEEGLEHCRTHHVRALVRSFELLGAAAAEDREAGYRALSGPLDDLRERDRGGFTVPYLAILLAELAIEHGELDHALVTLGYGNRVAARSAEMAQAGRAAATRGRALAAMGDGPGAERAYRAGLEFCAERSMHAQAVLNAAGLAPILAEQGEIDVARKLLSERLERVVGGDDLPVMAGPRAVLAALG